MLPFVVPLNLFVVPPNLQNHGLAHVYLTTQAIQINGDYQDSEAAKIDRNILKFIDNFPYDVIHLSSNKFFSTHENGVYSTYILLHFLAIYASQEPRITFSFLSTLFTQRVINDNECEFRLLSIKTDYEKRNIVISRLRYLTFLLENVIRNEKALHPTDSKCSADQQRQNTQEFTDFSTLLVDPNAPHKEPTINPSKPHHFETVFNILCQNPIVPELSNLTIQEQYTQLLTEALSNSKTIVDYIKEKISAGINPAHLSKASKMVLTEIVAIQSPIAARHPVSKAIGSPSSSRHPYSPDVSMSLPYDDEEKEIDLDYKDNANIDFLNCSPLGFNDYCDDFDVNISEAPHLQDPKHDVILKIINFIKNFEENSVRKGEVTPQQIFFISKNEWEKKSNTGGGLVKLKQSSLQGEVFLGNDAYILRPLRHFMAWIGNDNSPLNEEVDEEIFETQYQEMYEAMLQLINDREFLALQAIVPNLSNPPSTAALSSASSPQEIELSDAVKTILTLAPHLNTSSNSSHITEEIRNALCKLLDEKQSPTLEAIFDKVEDNNDVNKIIDAINKSFNILTTLRSRLPQELFQLTINNALNASFDNIGEEKNKLTTSGIFNDSETKQLNNLLTTLLVSSENIPEEKRETVKNKIIDFLNNPTNPILFGEEEEEEEEDDDFETIIALCHKIKAIIGKNPTLIPLLSPTAKQIAAGQSASPDISYYG